MSLSIGVDSGVEGRKQPAAKTSKLGQDGPSKAKPTGPEANPLMAAIFGSSAFTVM